ncbi:uncharacterized protein BDV14DRAFT_167493 [Aspergillus stella-maris]|uniref:uncharacterized protein n=1 Tax=Aspergillus stella-maris TaxID=1810926 RepID=UPI003CCCCB01
MVCPFISLIFSRPIWLGRLGWAWGPHFSLSSGCFLCAFPWHCSAFWFLVLSWVHLVGIVLLLGFLLFLACIFLVIVFVSCCHCLASLIFRLSTFLLSFSSSQAHMVGLAGLGLGIPFPFLSSCFLRASLGY